MPGSTGFHPHVVRNGCFLPNVLFFLQSACPLPRFVLSRSWWRLLVCVYGAALGFVSLPMRRATHGFCIARAWPNPAGEVPRPGQSLGFIAVLCHSVELVSLMGTLDKTKPERGFALSRFVSSPVSLEKKKKTPTKNYAAPKNNIHRTVKKNPA